MPRTIGSRRFDDLVEQIAGQPPESNGLFSSLLWHRNKSKTSVEFCALTRRKFYRGNPRRRQINFDTSSLYFLSTSDVITSANGF